MPTYDVAIIGAGCVGCSVGKHLAEKSDLRVCIIEKEDHLALHQSGRNSGVLHPGFNYPPGSLKARFATEGTARLKAYATTNDIPLREFGVVVVAQSDADEARLHTLTDQAEQNDVTTELLSAEELTAYEPYATGQAALYCPEAASIDSQKYVYTLAKETEHHGVDFYMGHRVTRVAPGETTHDIETTKGSITARYLVNAAGLYADRIAHSLGVGTDLQVVPFRGEYYELTPQKRHLCRTMIYPTPDPDLPFLGVHYTRRTDNKVIVGPNAVLAFGREAYRNTDINPRELLETLRFPGFWRLLTTRTMLPVAWNELNKSYRKRAFVAAAQHLVPSVTTTDFRRSYAGIRAQLVTVDGELVKDPVFKTGPRSLHVLNAVSPGLTSSLPFGDHLAGRVLDALDS